MPSPFPGMNPYIEQSLQPQLQDLARQQGMSQLGVNQQATQAGAFGDARQGVADANNKYNYGQLASQMIGQGYNNAFQSAQNAFQTDASISSSSSLSPGAAIICAANFTISVFPDCRYGVRCSATFRIFNSMLRGSLPLDLNSTNAFGAISTMES